MVLADDLPTDTRAGGAVGDDTIVRHRAIYLARRQSASAGLEEGTARIEEQPAQDDVPTEFDAHAKARELMLLLARLRPHSAR